MMSLAKSTALIVVAYVFCNLLLAEGKSDDANPDPKRTDQPLEMDLDMDAAFKLMSMEGEDKWQKQLQKIQDALQNLHPKQKRDAKASFIQTANQLQRKLDSFKGTAGKAKAGLTDLVKKYDEADSGTKTKMTNMVSTTVSAIEKFTKADSNPIGAVQATLDILSSFSEFAGPTGGIFSMGLSFVSGILGLFGKAPDAEKPIGDIVKEAIEKALDKFYDKTLKNQAHGCIEAFQHSKNFLDGVTSAVDGQIPDNSVSSLSAHVPVYAGLEFMGTLASVIHELIVKNSPGDGEKIMNFLELYSELATLKDMILLQMHSLIPNSQSAIRAGIWGVRKSVQSTVKVMLKILYSSDLRYVNVVSYFNPYHYPITDGYLQKILNLEPPDRSMYGVYSIKNLYPGTSYLHYLSFDQQAPHPVVTVERDDPVDWLLIPRGNNYFTIENLWGCSDGFEFCRGILSWDSSDTHPFCSIEKEDPIYWQLKKTSKGYRLINTWGCPSHKWCNAELSWDGRPGTYPIATVEFDDPCDWEVKRLRDYTP